MPVDQIARAVAINDLSVIVTAWCYVCDDCGRRDTFPDVPMPEGRSEFEASQKGWRMRMDSDDNEMCRCPSCCARTLPQAKRD